MENFSGIAAVLIIVALVFFSWMKNQRKEKKEHRDFSKGPNSFPRYDWNVEKAPDISNNHQPVNAPITQVQEPAPVMETSMFFEDEQQTDPYDLQMEDILEHDRLVQGVIMAEILGKPKSLR